MFLLSVARKQLSLQVIKISQMVGSGRHWLILKYMLADISSSRLIPEEFSGEFPRFNEFCFSIGAELIGNLINVHRNNKYIDFIQIGNMNLVDITVNLCIHRI